MKKFHFLIVLIAISLFGCRSRSGNSPVTYKISGLENGVTISPTQSGELNLNVTKIAAVVMQENLTLSLSGLPDGVTASINPKTGTPPFTASVVLTDSNAVAGTYSVKLLVHSSTSGDNSYSFTLTVSGTTHNTCNIAGYYPNSTAACSVNGSYSYVETVANDSMTTNKVIFRNFASTGYAVYGFVNCANSTISIPSQSLPNYLTVTGTGSFNVGDSSTAVYVSYSTMTLDSMVSTCQFSLIK